jgi:two-component system cell cycle sensor histidine kinase/response regulator CckA
MTDSSDVRKRALLDEPLPQTQRLEAMGRITAAVAHDFNNLLTVITGFAAVGQAECDDPSARQCFAEIASAGRKASELTRQLLAFGGRRELSPSVVDLNDAVENLSSLLRRVIPAGIELRLELSSSPVRVLVDPSQLEQVLLNLVLNSRDAIAANGTITVGTMTEDPRGVTHHRADSGWLQVSDTGSGISPDVRPHIFDPFFTTKPPETGTGLGLATINAIVLQSAGAIYVESALGVGTTMTVAFPVPRPTDESSQTGAETRRRARAVCLAPSM